MSASSSSSASASGGGGGGVPSLRLAAPAPPSAASRRIPPPCWTHEETDALIDSYRDKWYSLRRGNLRASHWDDVADAVDRRCHHLPAATPKTPVQCRHKVEKLRKRYRAERQRSLARDPSAPLTSPWVYFPKMDAMERGVAIGSVTAARPSPSPAPAPASSDDEIEDDYPDRRVGVGGGGGTTRSLHRLLANGGGGSGGLKFDIPKSVRSRPGLNPYNSPRSFSGFAASKPGLEEMRRRLEKKRVKKKQREREREGEAVGEIVAALQMLGDGFLRTEQMKMEMAREAEKARMEMELKRTEMMLDWQRQMVDSLLKEFTTKKNKKAKISPDA